MKRQAVSIFLFFSNVEKEEECYVGGEIRMKNGPMSFYTFFSSVEGEEEYYVGG